MDADRTEPFGPDEPGPTDGEDPPRGIFIGLAAGAGSAGGALAGGLSALDAVFNPGAARAREELDRQHERVVPTPSPGDRMLEDGLIVIELADQASDDGVSTMRRSSKDSPAP